MPWSEPPVKPVTPRAAAAAPALRRRLTDPEKRLWWHLRHRLPIDGTHFRRQVPIGRYVTDFCCLAARLVIEVDGGGHGYEAKAADDVRRTAVLEAGGCRVLRFTNREVMREIDSVLETILAALSPPPCGEGSGVGVVPPASGLEGGTVAIRRERSAPNPTSYGANGTTPTPTPGPSPQGGGEKAES